MAVSKALRSLKRYGPTAVLALVVVFGGITIWQAWDLAGHLRREAHETSRIYGQIVAALHDTASSGTGTLLNLARDVQATGIPLIITDPSGQPTAAVSIPRDLMGPNFERDPRVLAYVASLDRVNPPMTVPGGWQVHFGELPVARRFTWLGIVQLAVFLTALLIGVWAFRASVDRQRDRLWVAMARESAHQLGTPLMSASAWVERLADVPDERAHQVATHLNADLERLQRVAKRFERIGRPARQDEVALGVLAERVCSYFQPRLPRHANPVVLTVRAPEAGPVIQADAVLLEWALEALVRNAIDALSGRGGNVAIKVERDDEGARLTVADDGPGVPLDVRTNLFEPGVSTKPGGWGIGLALARRIVEDVHSGRLELVPTESGATFMARLPIVAKGANGDG